MEDIHFQLLLLPRPRKGWEWDLCPMNAHTQFQRMFASTLQIGNQLTPGSGDPGKRRQLCTAFVRYIA